MSPEHKSDGCLEPYRVLDLTREGCQLCGKILGDLGADVIMIEQPGGDASRRIGPFYHDIVEPDKSLFWFACNANKRGITLDIRKPEGRQVFRKLAMTADFVIESFPAGYLDKLGLGYSDLIKVNNRLIMTSITPFGQEGPYAHYEASDLITWAMSGYLYLCGDSDRAPTWVSYPQASFQAGSEAAAASLIAHWYRQTTGTGQHVDVSIQESATNFLWDAIIYWDLNKFNMPRVGNKRLTEKAAIPIAYPCRDGYVTITMMAGGYPPMVASAKAMVSWMEEEGMAPPWLKALDWTTTYDAMQLTQDVVDKVTEAVTKFVATKEKAEILGQAVRRGIIAAPVCSAKDIVENPQFKARDFWVNVEHPELGETLSYCGPFAKLSETPLRIRYRAPLVGEHNREIYEDELRLSRETILALEQASAI